MGLIINEIDHQIDCIDDAIAVKRGDRDVIELWTDDGELLIAMLPSNPTLQQFIQAVLRAHTDGEERGEAMGRILQRREIQKALGL